QVSTLRDMRYHLIDNITNKEAHEQNSKSRELKSDLVAQGGNAPVDEPEPESTALPESRPGAEDSVDKQQLWRLAAAKNGTRRLRRVAGLGDDDNNAES